MYEQIISFLTNNPGVSASFLVVVSFVVWIWGSINGEKYQRAEDDEELCQPGEHKRTIVNKNGDVFQVTIKAIMLRRGDPNL